MGVLCERLVNEVKVIEEKYGSQEGGLVTTSLVLHIQVEHVQNVHCILEKE